jgi:ferredoxin
MISRREFLRGRFHSQKPASDAVAAPGETRLRAVIQPNCIAFAQNVVCRSCGDACDAAAIRFSPRLNAAALPVVLPERCTGCGACLPVCPANAILLQAD